MISKALALRVFDAANMQRWNDKVCPVELKELDKQAHKMIIAYLLGKFEESREFDWIELIEGGIYEFLHRLILTDLKPQIFYKIKENRAKYVQLNRWVYEQLKPIIAPLGKEFTDKFRSYFSSRQDNINRRILSAAHFYATKWEFDIIERANPYGYEIPQIKGNLQAQQEKYYDLAGKLRFQTRWSHIHRIPKTSVLGHMLVVAFLSYLFSLEIKACPKRCHNNFFTGLFHDLPEVLTRDIISPVKRSIKGLSNLIKRYEREQMDEEVYRLIPRDWQPEMKMFTENEFASIATVQGRRIRKTSEQINLHYNQDRYNPRDGEIIEATDRYAAFLEAYLALKNGITSRELQEAKDSIKRRHQGKVVGGIDFGAIYADFE
jgi:putative hydrolase of HD superfamily